MKKLIVFLLVLASLCFVMRGQPRKQLLPPSKPINNTSVLVVILGETRAFKHTFDRFDKHVLKHLNADLALCVADKEIDWINNPFYARANYTWLFPDLSDWGDAFELAYRTKYPRTGARWRDILQVRDQFMGGIKDSAHQGSAGILLFMRWWLLQHLVPYDWYIITRSDYYYLHPHPTYVFDYPQNIWAPEGEDWGGITDRHVVVPRQFVHTMLDFVDALMRNPTGTVEAMKSRWFWNLEKVLRWRLEVNGVWDRVKRFPQVMFTVRDADTRTRWSQGVWDSELNLFIKYPDEYKRAKQY